MYIISKYKDYYDYLAGIYGVDNNLVLDRRQFDPLPSYYSPVLANNDGYIITLLICDKMVEGYFKNNKFYWGKDKLDLIADAEKLNEKYFGYLMQNKNVTHCIKSSNYYNRHGFRKYPEYHQLNCNIIDDPGKRNSAEQCPIMLVNGRDSYSKYPILKDIDVETILPAHDIWLMLSEWIARKITEAEPKVPIGSDKIRIQSHGFDLKTSFRGKEK